jgi:hypothetical protein
MADSPILEGFDADEFRTNIANTMIMGLPVPLDERPTFYFPETLTYPEGTLLDTEGKPIDARIKPVRTAPDPVQIPCAVEFSPDTTNETGLVGNFWQTRAALTVLDIHYAKVREAIEVDLAGRRYLIQEMQNVGLGSVTVYTLICFRKGVEATT